MTKAWISGLAALTLAFVAGNSTRASESPLKVAVSNYPLAYFAERLLGPDVSVIFPVPAGEDPAFFKPDLKAIAAFQRADVIALNGAEYEKWLPRVTLPTARVVDTSQGFKTQLIRVEQAVTHSHGAGGMHSHGELAFTTWLDFDQAAAQAEALSKALIAKRPAFAERIKIKLLGLLYDLRQLDEAMNAVGQSHAGRPLLGSHPVYQYLARRYQLKLESVHWEPGQVPEASEWAHFEALKARHAATAMLWEGPPDPLTEARLKRLGVRALVFDPCANRPESGDFLDIMRGNILRLQAGWRS